MIARDMSPAFQFFQPKSRKEAVDLLARFGSAGWPLAGGNDSFGWFKDRIMIPHAVIDLGRIEDLSGIRPTSDGVEVGATTTLATLQRHPLITSRYRLLSEAAGKVASPPIRNRATIGGNALQRARCWYYRSGQPCLRAGGDRCFARYADSINREHALLDTAGCVAASPSDLAPVLVALDADMVIENARGARTVPAGEFFIGPDVDETTLTCLKPGDLLTAIRLPLSWAGAHVHFSKAADRAVWDFPLVNVAAAMILEDGLVTRARLVCGGVSARPHRFPALEEALEGSAPTPEVALRIGPMAAEGAKALACNGYKIPLMVNLITRAIRDAAL
jgi:xanthine dehydrogenase YagS FAD-binding subunit